MGQAKVSSRESGQFATNTRQMKNDPLPAFRHQFGPTYPEGFSDPGHRAEQDIHFTGLDPLDVTDVQLRQFSQPLLAHALCHSLPTHGIAQFLERESESFGFRHSSLVWKRLVDGNGLCAVISFNSGRL